MGYKKLAIRGILWMSGSKFLMRTIAFIKVAILAHVLSPIQFGIFGIATLVLTLLDILTETGINVFLIQSEKDIKDYINSAWLVSIIRGLFISLLIFLSAPFIANFFNSPQAIGILYFIALVPFFRGFINPAEILFQKNLTFHKEFIFRTSIFVCDAFIAILISLLTHSVYSLVWGLLAGTLIELILSFVIIKPVPKLAFQKGYIAEIFNKGKWVTIYGIFNYLSTAGDKFVVGRVFGLSNLGLYEMAAKISIQPGSELSDVISRVTFPIYTKLLQDKKRLFSAFFRTIFLVGIGSFFIGVLILIFSKEIVTVIFGEKWLPMLPILNVLIVYGIISPLTGPSTALFLAVKKQTYVSAITVIRFFILAITIFPLLQVFGMIGAAYSVVLSLIFDIPVIAYFTYRIYKKVL